ncbi:MAG: hypothetical protein ACRC28_02940 [Clostridium sp.]|uniref:hypothetical protein n=1 Tax=Clostridium sp. TaxID=1506 RepID=UPI003F3E26C0
MSNKKEGNALKKIAKAFLGKTVVDKVVRVILLVMAIGVIGYYFLVNGFNVGGASGSFSNNSFNSNGFYSTSSYSNRSSDGNIQFGIGFGESGHAGGEGEGSGHGGHGGDGGGGGGE